MARICADLSRLTIAAVVSVTIMGAAATPAWAAGRSSITVKTVAGTYAGQLVVPLNKSQVLETDVPFTRVAVGRSEIADVLPLTDRTIYVLGKTLGSTSLSIFGKDDVLLAVMDAVVTYDVQGRSESSTNCFPPSGWRSARPADRSC